jgi:hypothetical protein
MGRQRRKSGVFVTDQVDTLNAEIRRAYVKVTGEDKIWSVYDRITALDIEEVYHKYKGRCVFCDKATAYLGKRSLDAARVTWYVPLNVGGEARPDNLIVSCQECVKSYRSTRKLREDMVGLDTFADVVERLVKAVRDGEDECIVAALKSRLNVRLMDIANCMRYVTKDDWIAAEDEIVEEGVNTIGDRVEAMAKGEDTKAGITNTVKQIVTTKQYKIIRRQDVEDKES